MAHEPLRAWIHDRFSSYAKISLLTLIFLCPVIFSRTTFQAFNITKITVLWIFGILGLTTFVVWSLHTGRRFIACSVIHAGAAFVAFGLVAALLSRYRAVSFLGMYRRYSGLLSLAMFFAVMFLIVQIYWERPQTLDTLIRVSVAAATVVASYVLVQAAGLDWIKWPLSMVTSTEPPGTIGNSNFAGAYLGIASPLFAYMALTASSRPSKAWLFALFGLNLLGIWFTSTRGGGLAAIAGLGTMVLLYRQNGAKLRWALGGTVLLAACGLVIGVLLKGQGLGARFETLSTLSPNSLLERFTYWRTAVRIVAHHPFFGTGPNTFYANFGPYRSQAEAAANGLYIADAPHNIFLAHAAETGVLGAGAYCVLIGTALFHAFRYLPKLTGVDRTRLLAFTAMLAAYLMQGFFSIDVPSLALSGWIALGAIAAIGDPKLALARSKGGVGNAEPIGSSSLPRQIPLWLTAGISLTTVLLLMVSVRPFLADVKAQSANQANHFPATVSFFKEGSELNPLEAEYHSFAAEAFAREGRATQSQSSKLHFTRAIGEYRHALQLRPRWIFYIVKAALASTDSAQQLHDSDGFARAERWWRMAVDLDPYDWKVRFLRSENYRVWARATDNPPELRRRQLQELHKSIAVRRDQPKAWVRLASAYNAIGQAEKAEAALRGYFGYMPDNEEKAAIIRSPDPIPALGQTARPPQPRDAVTVASSLIALIVASLIVYKKAKNRSAGQSRRLADPVPAEDLSVQSKTPDSYSFSRLESWPRFRSTLEKVFARSESIELLALPAFWSLALAIPHLGPLFGLPVRSGDWFAFIVYLTPGIVLLAVTAITSVLKRSEDHPRARDLSVWLTGLTLLGASMAAAHLPDLGKSLTGELSWTYLLVHLVPALLTVAIARLMVANRGSAFAA